jgi:hypothetical protein
MPEFFRLLLGGSLRFAVGRALSTGAFMLGQVSPVVRVRGVRLAPRSHPLR